MRSLLAVDEAACIQVRNDFGDAGASNFDLDGQRVQVDLAECFERCKQTVLHRRDIELTRLFGEQRPMNLLKRRIRKPGRS
jgi:hypothetical protein